MTGQHLIWTQCNADWCTHCLTSPYFFNLNGTNVTVIDHHPQLSGKEPYYQTSQCLGNSNYDLFMVSANAFLTFIGCTLVDIRAQFFAFAGVYGSIAFINTRILRMDFFSNFLWASSITSTAVVLFDNSYVTGWHRDHPLLNINVEEADFLYLFWNASLVIRNTTFEENYQLTGTFVTYFEFIYFLGLSLEITDSVFRYCIGAFNFNSYQPNAVILIRNVTLDSHFNYFHSNLAFSWMTSEKLVLSNLHFLNCLGSQSIMQVRGISPSIVLQNFEFTNNRLLTAPSNSVLDIPNAPTVVLVNITFHNNGAYSDSYAPYFFYNHLLSLGLINPYPQISQFFGYAASASCINLIHAFQASNVIFAEVTIAGDLETPCDVAITLDTLQGTNWTVAVNFTTVRIAGGSEFGIEELRPGKYANELTILLTNCTFEDLQSAVKFVNKVLIVHNSSFRNIGAPLAYANSPPISVQTGSVYLQDCYFLSNSGPYSGAVYLYLLESSSASVLSIINCVFDGNSGVAGGASDVQFGAVIQTQPVVVEIRDCVFRNAEGADPSFSLIVFNVVIGSGLISNCIFSSNQEMHMGLIKLAPAEGTFRISDTVISGVNAPGNNLLLLEAGSVSFLIENLAIRESTFSNGIFLIGSSLTTILCSFESNTGIVLYNDYGEIEDSGSYFWNNTNDSSPCCYLSSYSNSDFYGTSFIDNSATQIGAIDIVGPNSFANFEGCQFTNNSAKELTGVMQLTDTPIVTIMNCTFFSNSAHTISVFLLERVLQDAVIVNSVFRRNRGSGLLKAVYSSVLMQNVTFTDMDFAEKDYQLMLVSNSKLTLQNSTVTSLHLLQSQAGCFMSILMDSSATISNTTVSGVQCTQSVITVMLGSSLSLVASTFYNVNSTSASLINSSSKGSLLLESTHFHSISAFQGVLFTQYTDVSVLNSSFDMVKGAVVLHTESCSSVNIQSTYFGNVTSQTDVGGVQSVGCTQVVIQDSNFTYIWASVTAGIQVFNGNVIVGNCVFQQLSAQTHGAIEIEGGSLNISQSSFLDNSAGTAADSCGGGLYVNMPSNTSISMTSNSFIGNSATAGGALYWNSIQSMSALEGSNSYSGNTAVYGKDTAYSAFKLRLVNSSIPVIASGQAYTGFLLIEIVDQLGQVILTDNSSKVLMTGSSLAGNLVSTAIQGVFNLSAFIVTGAPGTSINVTIVPNTPNYLNTSIIFPLRECVIGEIEVSSGACVRCSEGTYSLSINGSTCSNCFTEAMCTNGSYIYPNSGYWRPNELYDGLFPCPNSDACTNNQTSTTGICASGYAGNMCQSCADGYSRSEQDKCTECSSKETTFIRMSFLVLALFIFIEILVSAALKSARAKHNFTGVYMKIFINYCHVTVLIASFGLNWPSVLKGMFNAHGFLGSVEEQLISLDCELNQAYFKKLVIIAVLPVVLLIANVVLWTILHCLLCVHHLYQKLLCSLIVSLFYVYPIIIRSAFSAFHCVVIEPGELWLRDEMDIPCWDRTHSTYALAAALPVLLLWGLGIPTGALLLLIKKRKRLKELSVKQELGFLCNGYRGKTFYWEVMIVYRKVFIIILYVFMSSEAGILQAVALCILLWIAGSLQSKFQAFETSELNKLEQRSIWVFLITVYSGIFFSTNDLSHEVEFAFAMLIIIANTYFLALWGFSFSRAFLARLVTRYARIGRWLSFLHPTASETTQERSVTLPFVMKQLYLSKLYHHIDE